MDPGDGVLEVLFGVDLPPAVRRRRVLQWRRKEAQDARLLPLEGASRFGRPLYVLNQFLHVLSETKQKYLMAGPGSIISHDKTVQICLSFQTIGFHICRSPNVKKNRIVFSCGQ